MKNAHISKLEDLLRALLKNRLTDIPKEMPLVLKQNYNIWAKLYS